jgi:hypothetical protein
MSQPTGMEAWDSIAGVRVGARRRWSDESDQGKVFFPAALVPHLGHPMVQALPDGGRHALAVRHLYQFLLATVHVETRVVNAAAERIANGRSGVDVPVRLRADALKVYTDEGFHALYSLELADQVAAATGVSVPDWNYGGFVGRLAAAGQRLLPDEPVLARLIQAVVFETLVTSVLNELPADASVVSTIRDVLRDHARDEGHHHRFFSAFFHELWSRLSPGLRVQVAHAFPAMVEVCLAADTVPAQASLRLAGLSAAAAREVIAASYPSATQPDRLNHIARATVHLCQSVGLLDLPGARDRFAAHGFAVS